jgi:hypothetical protein
MISAHVPPELLALPFSYSCPPRGPRSLFVASSITQWPSFAEGHNEDYRRNLHLSERPGKLSLANEIPRIVAPGDNGLELMERSRHPPSNSGSLERPLVGPGADVAMWPFGYLFLSVCPVLTSLGHDYGL